MNGTSKRRVRMGWQSTAQWCVSVSVALKTNCDLFAPSEVQIALFSHVLGWTVDDIIKLLIVQLLA